MKKKVVIIAGMVFPNQSSTGKISLQYAEMLKNECDVSIIFMHSFGKKFRGEIINGIQYYSVSGLRFSIENFFVRKNILFMVKACKAVGRVQRFFLINGNLTWFYRKVFKKLTDISKNGTLDIILSICSPFQSHLAALKFKQKEPLTIFATYTVDPFAKANQFKKLRLKKVIKLETKVYENADYNFVSEEVFATEQEKLKNVLFKTEILPYVLINLQQGVKENFFDLNKINIVYAGYFYDKIRNPEFMLETFYKLNNSKIILHLYSAGDCQNLINKYVEKSDGRIVNHPMVPYPNILKVMNSCDFLVNVSNNVKEFQPSKTFEYISFGKPVINFFEEGNSDKILEKYPLSIQVSKQNGQSNKLGSYIKENRGKRIDFCEVQSIYQQHTYSIVQRKLLKLLTLSQQ